MYVYYICRRANSGELLEEKWGEFIPCEFLLLRAANALMNRIYIGFYLRYLGILVEYILTEMHFPREFLPQP